MVAALGGMVVPALVYLAFNGQGFDCQRRVGNSGTATDIAFALGVLALLGNRVPAALKIFLMALVPLSTIWAPLLLLRCSIRTIFPSCHWLLLPEPLLCWRG